jgi:hypothetical protein
MVRKNYLLGPVPMIPNESFQSLLAVLKESTGAVADANIDVLGRQVASLE